MLAHPARGEQPTGGGYCVLHDSNSASCFVKAHMNAKVPITTDKQFIANNVHSHTLAQPQSMHLNDFSDVRVQGQCSSHIIYDGFPGQTPLQ